jgi:proteic killer suppression protein
MKSLFDCILMRYKMQSTVIKSFMHKGLESFFLKGSKAGIQPAHAHKLGSTLRRLNEATCAQDMNLPGWNLHPLKGNEFKNHYSIWVNGNWRMTFKFEGVDAILVGYQDHH